MKKQIKIKEKKEKGSAKPEAFEFGGLSSGFSPMSQLNAI